MENEIISNIKKEF